METPDLFGLLCREYFETGTSSPLQLERDDGTIIDDYPIKHYVKEASLRPLEKEYLELARGKVLDIGSGTGRIAQYVQQRGLDVSGVDFSEHLAHISRARNIHTYVMDVKRTLPDETYDSILLFGNGLGLPGTIDELTHLLKRLQENTAEQAIIIGEGNDPTRMKEESDLHYQKRNLHLCRYLGQRNWRIRSESRTGTYFNWLQVEPSLLEKIAHETGWQILKGPTYDEGSQ